MIVIAPKPKNQFPTIPNPSMQLRLRLSVNSKQQNKQRQSNIRLIRRSSRVRKGSVRWRFLYPWMMRIAQRSVADFTINARRCLLIGFVTTIHPKWNPWLHLEFCGVDAQVISRHFQGRLCIAARDNLPARFRGGGKWMKRKRKDRKTSMVDTGIKVGILIGRSIITV